MLPLSPPRPAQGGPPGPGGVLPKLQADSRARTLGLRPLLLLPLAWLFWQYVRDPSPSSIVSGIDLVMHEGGHLFFIWLGSDLLTVAGGTLFQTAIPVAVAVMFRRNGDPFAVAVALFWLGLNLVEVATYVADARAQLLPLVSPFPGAPVHDWNYLLRRAGLLEQDRLVAKAFRHGGIAVMTGSLLLGVHVLRKMGRQSPEQEDALSSAI
ncbi:MAG: hypothetical protein OEO23_12365 [Gemmatimonadota bacterium]|nr:hypothetical protein [Gemmatimonadota bacterium]